ncbi:CHASE2 domain-containing protein [Marinobacter sp.]|uniref:CHASE2 domain-containing protein n=1 Tax=Marinobacter sp. TaxID=50741 RepID=UPI0019F70C7F|nr:CHASE2 domain-containing protein [Marinobacter sp.]MBE0486229.1 CHASE2 domain-containing protein [Marinobacter sp.]
MRRDWLSLKTTPWSLGFLLTGILLLTQATTLPSRVDSWLYDKAITTWPAPIDTKVALVTIDEHSLDVLGQWPWDRSLHGRLIDRLTESGAQTIVFDILFPEPTSSDQILADAMARHGRVVLPIHYSPATDLQLMREQLPAPPLEEAALALGHAHVELDKDGIARGLYLYNSLGHHRWPALALAAEGKGLPPVASADAPAYTNVRSEFRLVPLAGGADTLPAYSYVDVLRQPAEPKRFAGKTVFVGATAAGFRDVLSTPFSGLSRPMSGVEFHANVYSASQQSTLISRAPQWLSLALALMILLILTNTLPRLKPAVTFGACAGSFVLVLCTYFIALRSFHTHLSAANAALLPMIAFPLASGLRLAMTNRFLNRQLDDMARTPQLSLPEPSRRHPVQLLEHLRSLLQPQSWLLAEGNDILAINGMSLNEAPQFSKAGQWVHQGNQSWIRLVRGGKDYVLGLTLPDDLSREVIQLYLQKLKLEDSCQHITKAGIQENISKRIEKVRTATERLGQMQAFIRHSFEHMPDGIIVTDELGVIRFANRHIEAWFKEPMPSLSGLPLTRLLEGHDPREAAPWHETVSETLTLLQSRTVDLKIHNKDFLIHLAPFALPDSDQSGIVANISDISELREQQRQHREAIDFISHDVRSPLVSQLALIEQLKRDPGHIDESQLEQLGRLARRSYHLAEEFVQLARAEQLTETRFYECELLAIVENARDSVCEQAQEKQISLQVGGTEDLWLKGNAELLERAVINLMTNAVQYSPAGSAITVQVYRAGHLACLAIADEGSGIDPHELPLLFDRYHRQKRSEMSGNHGTGLGLSFVKTVVEKHRGQITVDSAPDDGTTFTLKLPIADPMN